MKKRKRTHCVKRISLLVLAAIMLLCLIPYASSLASDDKAEVANETELLDAMQDSTKNSILFKESFSTSSSITVSKRVDLNGKTWTVSSGTVLVGAVVGNGTFQTEGTAEIRYPKTLNLTGAENGETITSITAGGKTDTNETYVKGKVVTVSAGSGSVSVYVLADNVAGGIAVARSVSVCKTSGGDYVVKGSDGGLYKVYKIKYVIRYVDSEGNDVQPGMSAPNDNVTEYTSYDAVVLHNLGKLQSEKMTFEFSGWYDENSNPVSSPAIPTGSIGDKTFYGVYVTSGNRPGGMGGFNLGSMISEMQEEEKIAEEEQPVQEDGNTRKTKRISMASSKTKTTFSNADENKVDLSGITQINKKTTNPTPMLIVGISIMVVAVVAGILILTKKH